MPYHDSAWPGTSTSAITLMPVFHTKTWSGNRSSQNYKKPNTRELPTPCFPKEQKISSQVLKFRFVYQGSIFVLCYLDRIFLFMKLRSQRTSHFGIASHQYVNMWKRKHKLAWGNYWLHDQKDYYKQDRC